LKDLAELVQKGEFFKKPKADQGSVRDNYDRWKAANTLTGVLDDHEKPLLVKYPRTKVTDQGDSVCNVLVQISLRKSGVRTQRRTGLFRSPPAPGLREKAILLGNDVTDPYYL
jgi:hypothetical protein